MAGTHGSLAQVPALVLAGGLGTRLHSAVADRPKVLAEIIGRPFLAFILDQLSKAGCREVVLCTGHRAEQVEEAFGSVYSGLRIAYSRELSPLGTGGALRLGLQLVQAEAVLVMNGDSYCAADLQAYWAWHTARSSAASLLLTRVADTGRYGRVELSRTARVRAFHEKGEASGPGWINAGVYLLRRELLESVRHDRPVSLERELFPAWISSGLLGYTVQAPFIDIGVPDSYAAAGAFFAGLEAR